MRFEWDEKKGKSNLKKHGIDFETAKALWLDDNRVEIHAPHPIEDRNIIIGKLDGKLWTAIYTMRGDTARIISVRRSRTKEARLYEEDNVG
ncbi:MAG: toxin [Deltaproteobacteria bacterium RIFCSPLOWO2_12_FULL_43_16]|nr:MAG: toxin [Deltaproteobacteria bacterium GWA2_43_19]OGQ11030.1 MAG: toxin [Deltaproteobacteria bacterium RIFCSPHIGHO2_02_FULL_43_33]OGQ61871.1 MAG: toxin [Deltaproteobacteria bacterium RIFCSPLOWO2_12_FULL_43_16]HBR16020.1 toxin [Deltaproteobacteria bacterium]